ncbi:MAG: elongation factor G [Anaerolineales bacterium]|nr:elongation factor G [Anaerolineales bacterium]
MKEYETSKIRNVAIVSHNGAGKTTLVERLLFQTGETTRMGNVQNGTTVMDFEEEEIERQGSISTALASFERNGVKVNLLDTPGYMDFIGEVNAAVRVCEGALVLVEAISGVEVGTEIVWEATEGMPRVLLINRMDRENVRVRRAMESIHAHLEGNFVNLQLPLGEGPDFRGVIDLLAMECRLGDDDRREPIPEDMMEEARAARLAVVEAAAEGDDELMEKYFEEDNLTDEEVVIGLREAMINGTCIPVLYSAPLAGIAVLPVLGALTRLMPAPNEVGPFTLTDEAGNTAVHEVSDDSPLAAFVFKTREDQYGKLSYVRVYGGVLSSDSRIHDVENDTEVRIGQISLLTGKEQSPIAHLHAGDIGAVVKMGDVNTNGTLTEGKHNNVRFEPIKQPAPIASVAVHPVAQSDVAKLSSTLNRLVAEDLTLQWHNELATHETILAGMGTTHLEIAVKKAHNKFGLNMTTSIPKVPYRETITRTNQADYTHKKQSGGAGQYARVFLRVESLDDDAEFEFGSEIFGGALSAPFVAATEKGCRQALEGGVLAGYPVTGVKAVVYDGKEHPVDSKEIAFQTAGREGFKKAVLGAGPVLLEPIYQVTVTVPSDHMGDVLGDMNSRRARVQGMDQAGSKSIINAEVPLAEMQTYAADLRSMTGGRGVYRMEFTHYGRMPGHLQEQLVASAKQNHQEE